METTTLNDFPFKAQVNCAFGTNDYDQAVCQTWEEVSANTGKIVNPIRWDTVQTVIGTYYDLQLHESGLPELDFSAARTTEQINANTLLVNTVADKTAIERGETLRILEQFYWATVQGRIKSERVLRPRKYHDELGDVRDESLGAKFDRYMKTGVVVVAVAGGLFGLFYLTRTLKLFSKVV